jgi:hypothetical protein
MAQSRSLSEFQQELDAQLHLLRKAAHEFDRGDLHEFRNIARALRVIFSGDDHGNVSLLELAGQGGMALPDTAPELHPRNIARFSVSS